MCFADVAQLGAETFVQAEFTNAAWAGIVATTSFATSMAVNALVTGLIVFKILKVFLQVKTTSIEKTLGSNGGTKLQHIIFVIIESGMALFTIQLIRVVFTDVPAESTPIILNLVAVIHQMFNVIIRPVLFYSSVLLIRFTWLLGHRTNNNYGADRNGIVLR